MADGNSFRHAEPVAADVDGMKAIAKTYPELADAVNARLHDLVATSPPTTSY